MIRKYIDVLGKVHSYKYNYKSKNRKPKCPKCFKRVNYVYCNINGNRVKLGFICHKCNQVYIFKKYGAFKIE